MRKLIFILGLVLLLVACHESVTGPDFEFKALEIKSFKVEPQEIIIWSSAILTWETKNALSVFIDQGIGKVEPVGSIIVSPEEMTAYTLTAQGMKARISRSVTLWVIQPAGCTKISTNYAKSGILRKSMNIDSLGENGGKGNAEEGTRTVQNIY